jgi:hypothetical protein
MFRLTVVLVIILLICSTPFVEAYGNSDSLLNSVSKKPSECESKKETDGFLPRGYLFSPLIADPRWPRFSASYRHYHEGEEFRHVGAVSFGGNFGLYRGSLLTDGKWQASIAAGIFSIFDLDAESYDLINNDFWVSFPHLSYQWNDFSALFRLFHQSSHLGDEYLLRDDTERMNLSYEGIALTVSYDLFGFLRIYGGGEYLFHRNPSELEAKSMEAGIELVSPKGFSDNRIMPFTAVYLQWSGENDWDTNLSARLGLEFRRTKSSVRKNQVLIEYYKGYSPNGQFYTKEVEYIGLGWHIYF